MRQASRSSAPHEGRRGQQLWQLGGELTAKSAGEAKHEQRWRRRRRRRRRRRTRALTKTER
eukprot:2889322-Pleurochrysis_carterae.AAC.2